MRAIVAVAAVAALSAQARLSFVVVPGSAFGPIRETTTRGEMERLFGKHNVIDGEIDLGESACAAGSVVFPGSKDQLEIAWQDAARSKVAFVRSDSLGRWATPRGVRVGVTLRRLVKIARHPLTFTGFGWGYGGSSTWQEQKGELALGLSQGRSDVPAAAVGDVQVRSDLPGLDLDSITVARLVQNWGDTWDVHDCHY